MARQASKLTEAIRSLLEESNGSITHGQARPRLKKMGFEIADDPGEMSEHYSAFDKARKEYEKPANADEFKAMVEAIGKELNWSAQTIRVVQREHVARKLFRDERNNFDVCKHNWSLKRSGGTETNTSKKPKDGETSKAKVAKKVAAKTKPTPATVVKAQPKHGKKSDVGDYEAQLEALRYVEEQGGTAAVQKEIDAMKAEAVELREQADAKDSEAAALAEKLEQVELLKKRIDKSAA
jgi:uncharacterized coiled-coil DUF342 family protein